MAGRVGRLFLLGMLLWLAGTKGQSAEPLVTTTRDPVEQERCLDRLNQVFEALRKFRSEQHRLPDALSELVPDYIQDRRTLICPFVDKSADLRTWMAGLYKDVIADEVSSYAYEFCLVRLPREWWRGVARTYRDYKEDQRGVIGDKVPLIRCMAHEPRINVSFGGDWYPSDTEWETRFEGAHPDLSPAGLQARKVSHSFPAAQDFPGRNPAADSTMLDLTSSYNGLLQSDWQGYPGNNLKSLPPAVHELDGVKFDVRGVVQLAGRKLPITFPARTAPISVGRRCKRIHVLQGTAFTPGDVMEIARYKLQYADGSVEQLAVTYGVHVADWWLNPENSNVPSKARVVWTGLNDAAKSWGESLRLFLTTYDNPHPDREILSVTFESAMKRSSPFMLAITVER